MPTRKCATTLFLRRTNNLRAESDTSSLSGTLDVRTARASTQPSRPFGTPGTITPSHRPRRFATETTTGEPNGVRRPSRTRTSPAGVSRTSSPRATGRATTAAYDATAGGNDGGGQPPTTTRGYPGRNEMQVWETVGHGENRQDHNREDGGTVASGADARAVPRAASEGHRASLHRRVRPRLRARHLPLCGLRCRAVQLGREVRLGLRLAGFLRAGERAGDRRGDRHDPRDGSHRGDVRRMRRPSGPPVPRRAASDGHPLLHQLRGSEAGGGMTRTATFGAGCFWGVEAAFRQLDGVTRTRVGYAGGHLENPSYGDVVLAQERSRGGRRGHVRRGRGDVRRAPGRLLAQAQPDAPKPAGLGHRRSVPLGRLRPR